MAGEFRKVEEECCNVFSERHDLYHRKGKSGDDEEYQKLDKKADELLLEMHKLQQKDN